MANAVIEVRPGPDRPGPVRLVGAGLAAGLSAGLAAGAGARLAMYAIRLLNSSHDGEMTHAQSEVGRWTIEGTTELLITGVFFGAFGGFVYLVLRPLFVGPTVARGLSFGVAVWSYSGTALLDHEYEYVRYVSPIVSLSMFYVLFPLYGMVVAVVADRIAPVSTAGSRHPRTLAILRIIVLGLVLAGATSTWRELQFRF